MPEDKGSTMRPYFINSMICANLVPAMWAPTALLLQMSKIRRANTDIKIIMQLLKINIKTERML